eukprot:2077882-Rhodomonas_salina.1
MPDLSYRLLCWLEFLEQFDLGDICYLPGRNNPVSDAISESRISGRPRATNDPPPQAGDIVPSPVAFRSSVTLLANPLQATRSATGATPAPPDRLRQHAPARPPAPARPAPAAPPQSDAGP